MSADGGAPARAAGQSYVAAGTDAGSRPPRGLGRVPWCGPRWASRIGPAGEASRDGHGPAGVGTGATLPPVAAAAGVRVALVDAVPQAGGRFRRQPASPGPVRGVRPAPGPPESRRGRRM